MTEKRFKLMPMANKGDIWYGLFDNYKKEYVIKKIWLGAESACDLLNELNDKNEQLKSDCDYRWKKYCNTRKEMLHENEQLKRENEQLKQTNQELNDELQETMGYLSLKSGIERENEQLKQQFNSVYEIVKEYVMSHHCISTMRMLKKIEKVMWND